MAFDPEKNLVDAWLNGEKLADQSPLPPRNKDGRFLTLLPHATRFADVAVLREMAEPEDFARPEPPVDGDRVTLGDGEVLVVSELTLSEGTYVARTAEGERRIAADKVFSVEFRTSGELQEPEQPVAVQTATDRLTVTSPAMNQRVLHAKTPYLEHLQVQVPAIELIDPAP
jgi:hypothetical protein